ncbi:ABC transporter ATP-binding protein [Methylobacterium trifolii]|uniref:Vitamin B12 import ATP-binding protein BtuD n=1 Tax=Methylobacterium trifolii TaxID=1003092 RepID=A0ABQ4TXT4_9HYPH|nr:ABC transporter ATP-binding protein [Methylobacterium trifolii]GJE59876.1 Vitamin B12 import ATP-binding protein BtuD [Methylobacterium trifolii]
MTAIPNTDRHEGPRASAAVPRLEVRGVGRRFGRVAALDDVSLALAPGEIVAVLGESGCGKSTLLRLIAGLEAPDTGEIRIDGGCVAGPGRDASPETRGVGLMFQDYALFPHMSVLANVCFGLKGSRAQARAAGLARLAEVGLAHRAESYPGTLSGGEAQRVALACALAPRPRMLLLDEPFSNLDAHTRGRVRADTLALLRASGITAILVTHDPGEALDFADRIALMRHGRIVQSGSAEDLWRGPASPFAARALGEVVEVPGRAQGGRVETALGALPTADAALAGPVRVSLRPDAIRIGRAGAGVPARVLHRRFAGAGIRLHLAVEGLDAPLSLPAAGDDSSAPGDVVFLSLDPREAFVFSG